VRAGLRYVCFFKFVLVTLRSVNSKFERCTVVNRVINILKLYRGELY
jgi:hypothetical protein